MHTRPFTTRHFAAIALLLAGFFSSRGADSDRAELEEVQIVALPSLLSASCVTASSDGRFVYAAAFNASFVSVFTRDPETGLLQLQDEITTPDLHGCVRVRLSPDNQFAAVPSWGARTVTLFKREGPTGRLTILDVGRQKEKGAPLATLADAQFSKDNHFIYAAVADGLAVFRVDGEKLMLIQHETANGALRDVRGLGLHPGGQWVYLAGYASGALAVLQRDEVAGTVKVVDVMKQDEEQLASLAGAFRVACSPDGKHVYVSSGRFGGSHSVTAFEVNLEGKLKFIEAHTNNVDGFNGFEGGNEIVVSPDGTLVYAVASLSDRLVRFRRDATTGKLKFLGSQEVGGREVPGAAGVCFSPDGRFVYVADEDANSIVVFKNR